MERNGSFYGGIWFGPGRKYFILLLTAVLAVCFFAGCTPYEVTVDENGHYTTDIVMQCDDKDRDGVVYNICLTVKADGDGKIVSVEDDGTIVSEGGEESYKKAQSLFEELEGKDLKTMKEVDVVSGAEYPSKTILEAVKHALKNINKHR